MSVAEMCWLLCFCHVRFRHVLTACHMLTPSVTGIGDGGCLVTAKRCYHQLFLWVTERLLYRTTQTLVTLRYPNACHIALPKRLSHRLTQAHYPNV